MPKKKINHTNKQTNTKLIDLNDQSKQLVETSSPTSQPANTNSMSSSTQPNPSAMFSVGNLVWGAVRGHTAWPGKIVPAPNASSPPQSDATSWVRWFGGKPSVELVQISSLKSLSEGLEAHHKAQKDNRK